jgi:glycosyltransferase involved in cell wall biosynthesis
MAGVPVIVHTFHGNSLRHYFSPAAAAVFRRVEMLLARFTDAICVVSPQQIDELSGEFGIAPRERFRAVPLGIALGDYLCIPPAPPGPVLRVAWVGRLVGVKNVPLLIGVMEETLRRSGGIEFVVAGDGPDSGLLRDAAARLAPRVVWRGWETDMPRLLADCHLLIQTSTNEGTPLALIQGMAAARPFLSTAAGGIVDMVAGAPSQDDSGCRWYDNAVLAAPDPAAFAHALIRFAADRELLTAMGLAARRFANQRFAATRLIGDLDALYRQLLEQKSVRPLSGPVRLEGEKACTF